MSNIIDNIVAIGGLGGSGTRVVAEILEKRGLYLGPRLNQQHDNLLFTLLFKRSDWFLKFPTKSEVAQTIDTFLSATKYGVSAALREMPPEEVSYLFNNAQRIAGPKNRFDLLRDSTPPNLNHYSGLGWKEPNTHIFLTPLAESIPNLKYIHVIRNGLDIALSKNRQQLKNWGAHYGFASDTDIQSPQNQLRFWIAATQTVINQGQALGPKRFYLLNYDNLCQNFRTELEPLQDFLGWRLNQNDIAELEATIDSSFLGKYRNAPADTFSADEYKSVERFGFRFD